MLGASNVPVYDKNKNKSFYQFPFRFHLSKFNPTKYTVARVLLILHLFSNIMIKTSLINCKRLVTTNLKVTPHLRRKRDFQYQGDKHSQTEKRAIYPPFIVLLKNMKEEI